MTHFLEYYLVNSQKLSSPVTRVYFYTKSAPLVVKNRFKKKRYRFPIDYFCHYNPLKWFISSHIHPNDSFSEFWQSFWQNFPTLIFQFIWPQLTPKLTSGSVYNSERITRQCPSSSFTNKQIQFQFDQEKILSFQLVP